jgi:phosphatidylglycerol lysyltransferase
LRPWLRRLAPFLAVGMLVGATALLHHELRAYHYEDVRRAVARISATRVLGAVGLAAFSYWILTGYDTLALRYLGRAIPYRRTALASFLGYVFSHNIGLSVLGGAAPRYRLYSGWGLGPGEIATLVGFGAVTFWLGIFATSGSALLLDARALGFAVDIGEAWAATIGAAMLAAVAAYVAASVWRRSPVTVRGWAISLPSPPIALAQIGIGVVDWVVAAAVLYVLLPEGTPTPFLHFVGLFVVAQVAGVSSHVPAGLGVFETVILLGFARSTPAPALVGSLIVYRGVYYLLPLALATAMLAAYEALERREKLARGRALVGRWLAEVAPRLVAVATFACGALLLFSGVGKRHAVRLDWLQGLLPVFLLEASHFLASLVGLGLVLLASGLQRRLDAAYHVAVGLLTAGAVLALLKGFDYEESLLLLAMLAALLPCRREFYRRASLISERFTWAWAAAVTAVLGASLWLGFFVHRHVEYSHELWWQFSFFDDAPRFLRASVGVVVAALAIATWHLLRPAPLRDLSPSPDTLAAARVVVDASPVAAARLALLGDKSFLFNADRSGFVMYSVAGRSCVAMGDPVGVPASAAELVWQFKELCDRHDGWPVFYEASASALPIYLDAGLAPIKFGEEARVPLAELSLEGARHKQQRYVLRTVEREGATFEVSPASDVARLLPELVAISAGWIAEKHVREKGFSLGYFDEAYLEQFPIALVRSRGEIVAFANLWCGADREEVSPDLMRYSTGAPASVMEYLFLRIMLWAKDEGYRWFNLGMAPLAGLEARASAPLWNRIGALAFRHGEQFYNFQGLRQFKEKFHPQWRSKYLVYPGGIVLPRVLANVAALVSGGLRGAVNR